MNIGISDLGKAIDDSSFEADSISVSSIEIGKILE
jgi:hypothetical protein